MFVCHDAVSELGAVMPVSTLRQPILPAGDAHKNYPTASQRRENSDNGDKSSSLH